MRLYASKYGMLDAAVGLESGGMMRANQQVMMSRKLSAPSREEELALLQGLIAGDEGAWRLFQRQYSRLIYRCIRRATYRFVALLGTEDEREIYANLMLQLLTNDKRKLRLFETGRGSRLSTWLGMLATHTAYDYLRTVRRDFYRIALSDVEWVESEQSSPHEEVEKKERGALVEGMMAELSDKDQEFVVLYFSHGMSPEAVATVMNISVKTVYSKKHKICSRLEGLATAVQLAA